MKKTIIILIVGIYFIVNSGQLSAHALKKTFELMIDSEIFHLVEGNDFIISEDHILVSPVYITPVLDFVVPGKGIWWDDQSKSVTFAYLDKDDYIKTRLTFKVGKSYFTDFDKKIEIRIKVKLIDGRVYLPLRTISEAFRKDVYWESINGKSVVQIRSKNSELTQGNPDIA